jgi:hypothetical protein
LQSLPLISRPTPEVKAGRIAANKARKAAEAITSGPNNQHSLTDKAIKDPNKQDNNNYKLFNNFE